MTAPKIVEFFYEKYQGLSKRRILGKKSQQRVRV